MNDCRISVVIPVFNAGQFLSRCLDSVVSQSFTNFEVILINDASTDATQEIIGNWVAGDERVSVIQLETNVGVSAARNAGLNKAVGDFIIFLDADDYWMDPAMLAALYDLAASSQVDIVEFGFVRSALDDESRAEQQATLVHYDRVENTLWPLRYSVCAKLIKSDFLRRTEIVFDTSLIIGEDALFSVALYCEAGRLLVTDAEYYCYRVNKNSVSQTSWNRRKLMDAFRWTEAAVRLVSESDFHAPSLLLQTILRGRMEMIYKKLGRVSVKLLDDKQLASFLEQWQGCLRYLDEACFEGHESNESLTHIRTLYLHILSRDVDAYISFFGIAPAVTISPLSTHGSQ